MINLKLPNTVIENINLVVFDRDGTLIDLYHYWSKMLRLRAELIAKKLILGEKHVDGMVSAMGVDIKNKRIKKEGPVGLKKREIVMEAAIDYLTSVQIENTYDICFESFKEVDQISQTKLDILIKPIDGMFSLLDKLHSKGCKLAIATTDRTNRAEISMDYLGIKDKFDCILGADSVSNPKPAPDMIEKVMTELNIDKNNTVMIGDAPTDISMGLNANIKASIGVCTGLTSYDDLKGMTPYVINDISEIDI